MNSQSNSESSVQEDVDNNIRKSADFRADSAIPIVDLLIQMGDVAIISHLHDMEKEKNRDITKNEKKRKTNEQKVGNNVPFTSDIDDNIDIRIFSVRTQNQLESFQLILKLLNTRQLKALQFASRYVLRDVYVLTVLYVLTDVYVLTAC